MTARDERETNDLANAHASEMLRRKQAEERVAELASLLEMTRRHHDAAEADVDRKTKLLYECDEHCQQLEIALRDTLQEIDELGAAYTAVKKRYEPPYIIYVSWSRPGALAALTGEERP